MPAPGSFHYSLGGEQMNLRKIYTTLLTADLAAAERWYTKLLGRGPDFRPMDTLLHWELLDHGGLMLSSSDEIAGKGMMFVYVENLAAERPPAAELGDHARRRHPGRLLNAGAGARSRWQPHHAGYAARAALPARMTRH
jgi:catechol 2,3-dioxygenase-like lactoylglutathione lyase family enzyme